MLDIHEYQAVEPPLRAAHAKQQMLGGACLAKARRYI